MVYYRETGPSPGSYGSDALDRLQVRLDEETAYKARCALRTAERAAQAPQRQRVVDWVRSETARKLTFADDVRKTTRRTASPSLRTTTPHSDTTAPPPYATPSRRSSSADHVRHVSQGLKQQAEARRMEVQRGVEEKRLRGEMLAQYRAHQVAQVRQRRFASRERQRVGEAEHRSVVQKHAAETDRAMKAVTEIAEREQKRERREQANAKLSLALLREQRAEMERKQRRREEAAQYRRQQGETQQRGADMARVVRTLKRSRSAELQRSASMSGGGGGGAKRGASGGRGSGSGARTPSIERKTYSRLLGAKAGCLDAMQHASKRSAVSRSRSPARGSPAKV